MSVSGILKNNRAVLGVLGVGAVATAAFLLSGDGAEVARSDLRSPSRSTTTVQAEKAVSPQMDRELSVADAERTRTAVDTGGSSMPTPRLTEQSAFLLEQPELPVEPREPLARPELPTLPEPPVVEPSLPEPVAVTEPAPVQPPAPRPNPYTARMALTFEVEPPATYAPAAVQRLEVEGPEAAPARTRAVAALDGRYVQGEGDDSPTPGTVVYGYLANGANSDAPGPVIAVLAEGPLKGSRLVGSFQTNRADLTLSFDRLVTPDGETRDVSVVAVDPKRLTPGVRTSINRHLIPNIAVVAATEFLKGYSQVITGAGATLVATGEAVTVTNPSLDAEEELFAAAGAAAGATGEAITETFGRRPPTIRIEAGAPLGLLFL